MVSPSFLPLRPAHNYHISGHQGLSSVPPGSLFIFILSHGIFAKFPLLYGPFLRPAVPLSSVRSFFTEPTLLPLPSPALAPLLTSCPLPRLFLLLSFPPLSFQLLEEQKLRQSCLKWQPCTLTIHQSMCLRGHNFQLPQKPMSLLF